MGSLKKEGDAWSGRRTPVRRSNMLELEAEAIRVAFVDGACGAERAVAMLEGTHVHFLQIDQQACVKSSLDAFPMDVNFDVQVRAFFIDVYMSETRQQAPLLEPVRLSISRSTVEGSMAQPGKRLECFLSWLNLNISPETTRTLHLLTMAVHSEKAKWQEAAEPHEDSKPITKYSRLLPPPSDCKANVAIANLGRRSPPPPPLPRHGSLPAPPSPSRAASSHQRGPSDHSSLSASVVGKGGHDTATGADCCDVASQSAVVIGGLSAGGANCSSRINAVGIKMPLLQLGLQRSVAADPRSPTALSAYPSLARTVSNNSGFFQALTLLRLNNVLGQALSIEGETEMLGNWLDLQTFEVPFSNEGQLKGVAAWDVQLEARLPGYKPVKLRALPTVQVLELLPERADHSPVRNLSTSTFIPKFLKSSMTADLHLSVHTSLHRANEMLQHRREQLSNFRPFRPPRDHLDHTARRVLLRSDPGTGIAQDPVQLCLSSTIFVQNRSPLRVMVAPVLLPGGGVDGPQPWRSTAPEEVPLDAIPFSVPLEWLAPQLPDESRPPLLYCGLCEELSSNPMALQELVEEKAWEQMKYGTSKVASTYTDKLDARRLTGSMQHLCVTIYGISKRIAAAHQGLFFTIAIEPVLQICNRLCVDMEVRFNKEEPPDRLKPGEDKLVEDTNASVHLVVVLPSGMYRLKHPMKLYEVQNGSSEKYLHFDSDVSSKDSCADFFEAVVRREVGTQPLGEWDSLEVYQYSTLARRLEIFVGHWFINRTSRKLCVKGSGINASHVRDHLSLPHIPNNNMHALSMDITRNGKVSFGMCNHNCCHAKTGTSSSYADVHRPMMGNLVVPFKNILQEHFTYLVSPAPSPYVHTLIIEVIQRYKLWNQTQYPLWVRVASHPDWRHELQPAPSHSDGRPESQLDQHNMGREHFREVTLPPGTSDSAPCRLVVSGVAGGSPDTESASFTLSCEKRRHRFHIVHQVSIHDYDSDEVMLVRQEKIEADQACEVVNSASFGWTAPDWCLTEVDVLVNNGVAVARFQKPNRPQVVIFNRTEHTLKFKQYLGRMKFLTDVVLRAEKAHNPTFVLERDHKLPFSWYSHLGKRDLLVEIPGGKVERYKNVMKVGDHSPLPIRRDIGSGREVLEWYTVTTRIGKGNIEVHFGAWAKLTNSLTCTVEVTTVGQSTHNLVVPHHNLVVPPGCKVVLPRRALLMRDERLRHISSADTCAINPAQQGPRHVSFPIRGDDDEKVDILVEVAVAQDRRTGVFEMEIKHVADESYFLDNQSKYVCTVRGPSAFQPLEMHPQSGLTAFLPATGDAEGQSKTIAAERPWLSFLSIQLFDSSEQYSSYHHPGVRPISEEFRIDFDRSTDHVVHISPCGFLQVQANKNATGAYVIVLQNHRMPLWAPQHVVRTAMGHMIVAGTRIMQSQFLAMRASHLMLNSISKGFAPDQDRQESGDVQLRSPVSARSRRTNKRRRACYLKALEKGRGTSSSAKPGVSVQFQGFGVACVDHDALREVGYVCAAGVSAEMTTSTENTEEARVDVKTVQVTIKDPESPGHAVVLQPSLGWMVARRMTNSGIVNLKMVNAASSYRWKAIWRNGKRLRSTSEIAEYAEKARRICVRETDRHDVGAICNPGAWPLVCLREGFAFSKPRKPMDDMDATAELIQDTWVGNTSFLDAMVTTGAKEHTLDTAIYDSGNHSLGMFLDNNGQSTLGDRKVGIEVLLGDWEDDSSSRPGQGGHFREVSQLEVKTTPLEVQLTTESLYPAARWCSDLVESFSGTSRDSLKEPGRALIRSAREAHAAAQAYGTADAEDELLGEPRFARDPKEEDFAKITPLFVSKVSVERFEAFLSVHFAGKLSNTEDSELIRALDSKFRLCLPFDISQARLVVGHRMWHWWPWPRFQVQNIEVKSAFYPDGVGQFAQELLGDALGALTRQLPKLVGFGQVLFSPVRLLKEFSWVMVVVFSGLRQRSLEALIAAVMLTFAAFIASIEGTTTVLAKVVCLVSLGKLPPGLKYETLEGNRALQQAVQQNFRWHAEQVGDLWLRVRHQLRVSVWSKRAWLGLIAALAQTAGAVVSSLLLLGAKLLQASWLSVWYGAWVIAPAHVVTKQSRKTFRAGAHQFRLGCSTQFSPVAATANVLQVEGAGLQNWRIRQLPFREGTMVAFDDGQIIWLPHAHDTFAAATSVVRCCRRRVAVFGGRAGVSSTGSENGSDSGQTCCGSRSGAGKAAEQPGLHLLWDTAGEPGPLELLVHRDQREATPPDNLAFAPESSSSSTTPFCGDGAKGAPGIEAPCRGRLRDGETAGGKPCGWSLVLGNNEPWNFENESSARAAFSFIAECLQGRTLRHCARRPSLESQQSATSFFGGL